MSKNKKKLEEAVSAAFDELQWLPAGSEERARATQNAIELYRLKNDQDKNVAIYLDAGVKVLGIVVGTAVNLVFIERGFKFEETGIYTSQTFRNLWSSIKLPKI